MIYQKTNEAGKADMTAAPVAAPKFSPLDALTAGLARSDFASQCLQGVPVDFWESKLGADPANWVGEALAIRAAFESAMIEAGVGVSLPRVPQAVVISFPGGGVSPQVQEFFLRLNSVPVGSPQVPNHPNAGSPTVVPPPSAGQSRSNATARTAQGLPFPAGGNMG